MRPAPSFVDPPAAQSGSVYIGDNVVIDFVAPRTLLYLHNNRVPSDRDAEAVRALHERLGPQLGACVCLVLTDGGAPSRPQRERAAREFGSVVSNIRSAIVSDSATVRFAIATMTLIIKHIASFNVAFLDDAVGFLNFSASETGALRGQLRQLAMTLEPGRFTTFDAIAQKNGFKTRQRPWE